MPTDGLWQIPSLSVPLFYKEGCRWRILCLSRSWVRRHLKQRCLWTAVPSDITVSTLTSHHLYWHHMVCMLTSYHLHADITPSPLTSHRLHADITWSPRWCHTVSTLMSVSLPLMTVVLFLPRTKLQEKVSNLPLDLSLHVGFWNLVTTWIQVTGSHMPAQLCYYKSH